MHRKASMLSSGSVSRCGAIVEGTGEEETAIRGRLETRIDMITPLYQAEYSRLLQSAALSFVIALTLANGSFSTLAQTGPNRTRLQNRHSRDALSPEAREMVELASGVVCKERIGDPRGSVPIDEMQGRPSLPVQSPEAVAVV